MLESKEMFGVDIIATFVQGAGIIWFIKYMLFMSNDPLLGPFSKIFLVCASHFLDRLVLIYKTMLTSILLLK